MKATQSIEQYLPKTIDEVVFASSIERRTIEALVEGTRPFPVSNGKNGILLYGPPGTGKSTLARMLPDAIEQSRFGGEAHARLVRCAPDENDCKLIGNLSGQAKTVPLSSKYHYFILDEADNLTTKAMKSLKSLMNMTNTVLILTTNNLQGIEAGVRDRSHCIPMLAAPSAHWLPLCHRILNDHGVNGVEDSALIALIDRCNGSAREVVDAVFQVIEACSTDDGSD